MSRMKFLKLLVVMMVLVILGKLFYIQIIQHDEWVAKAAAQQTLQNVLKAERGEIYMMDGETPVPVVMNATVYTVIVDPMLAEREVLEEKLAPLISDTKVAEWNDVFKDTTRRYYIVAKNVRRGTAEKVAELDLTGVWLQANNQRVYPEGTLASTMLGFVNADGIGQYGVEGALNKILAGKDGLLKTVKDVNNVALSITNDYVKTPAEDGEDVVLTIDRNMQAQIEKILAAKSQEYGFKNMSALVMNPRNGEILAMANHPGYDPGDYGNVESAADYINHVVEDAYEPASMCKTFAFATGLEYGVMTPEKTFYNTGEITVDNWPIRNASQQSFLLGNQTMQVALTYSLNTGSTQVLRWLGGSDTEITAEARNRLYDYYYNHFGLGQATGIELYESLGMIQPPDIVDGANSTYANMTFGQNMQATMIQVAAAFASVINGGNYYTPTVVAGKLVDGKLVRNEQKEAVRQTVSAETSATMRQMLITTRKALKDNGTDQAGYDTGGKTGTAQVIKDGAYSFDETVGSYVGFGGPAGQMPEYLIMVRIWEDGKKADGAAHARPLFNEIKNYVQDYLHIKPVV